MLLLYINMSKEEQLIKEELTFNNGWLAIKNSGKHDVNLILRINALNIYFFQDQPNEYAEELFSKWEYLNNTAIVKNCLCGMKLKNTAYTITRGNQKCIIGSKCIEKFIPRLYEILKKNIRKTFDCEDCNKRINKDDDEHGKCIDCDKEICCKYKKCYSCIFNNKIDNINNEIRYGLCIECNKQIDYKYTKCYNCKFKNTCKCGNFKSEQYKQCYSCFNK